MRHNVFSLAKLKASQYNPDVQPTTFLNPIPLRIAPLRARSNVVSASQRTAALRNIGVSNTTFDVSMLTDPNADLAVVYSNGFRLQYLAFKATGVLNAGCLIRNPDSTQAVTVVNPDNTVEVINVDIPGTEVITSYSGNAVVPPLPNLNVPTNNTPLLSKVPVVPSKINC